MNLEPQIRAAALKGLRQWCELVKDQAARNVPEGDPREDPDPLVDLAKSGHVRADGDGFVISFDTPYAAKVHEDLHLKHPRGGGAKYLQQALAQHAKDAQGIVATEVRARTARGLRKST
ncbi:MAG: hypothetical protein H0W81_06560 [Chloroflexi bacterium]|nr:hypothetical protein [Chloroflexota bacterium]